MAHPRLRLAIAPGCVTARLPPPRWGQPVRGALCAAATLLLAAASAALVWLLPPALSGALLAVLLLCGDLLLWSLSAWLVERLERLRRSRRLLLRPGALVVDGALLPLAGMRAACVGRRGVRLVRAGAAPVRLPCTLQGGEARRLQALLNEAIQRSRGDGGSGAVPAALRALLQSLPTARSRAA